MKLTRYAEWHTGKTHACTAGEGRGGEQPDRWHRGARGRKPRLLQAPHLLGHRRCRLRLHRGQHPHSALNVIVSSVRGADPEPLRLILDDLLDFAGQFPPDSPAGRVPGRRRALGHCARLLGSVDQRTGKPFGLAMSQRIYELRQVIAARGRAGSSAAGVRRATPTCWPIGSTTSTSTHPWRPMGLGEARRWRSAGGAGTSSCGKTAAGRSRCQSRSRPTSHGIAVSLVYTPRELRNCGYASACVAALSQQLLDAGWEFCTLYTDLANSTSNSIYQRIGYRPVCDSNEYHFLND